MCFKKSELLRPLVLVLAAGVCTLARGQGVSAPSAVQAHVDQSIVYYIHGDLRHAIEELRAAQQLAPRDPQVNFMLGNALYRDGDIVAAAKAYEKTLAVKPNHFEAHMSRGFALFEVGEVDQAVAEWAAAKKVELREPFARAALAVGLYAAGRADEAKVQYATALGLSPRYGDLDNLRLDIRWKPKALGIARRILASLQTN